MKQPKKRTSPKKSLEKSSENQPSGAGKAVSSIRSTSQLALELGLSRWTVSRVINGHPGVHPDTVERVHAAMRAHRFSPNPLAQGLRRGKTSLVGICAPGIDDYFLGPKLELLRHNLEQHGFQAMIGLTGNDPDTEKTTLDHFRRLCVAGVVLFASRLALRDGTITRFHEASIPLVMVDPLTARHAQSLVIDRAYASREVVGHLVALGHRSLMTVGMANGGLYTRTRLAGLKAALEAHGLPPERHLLHLPIGDEASDDYEEGYRAAEEISLEGSDSPTALLAVNDRVALGLIEGFRQRGVQVPRDVSIVGYDNMQHTAYTTPRLTTIDPGAPELMEKAAAQLLAALRPAERPPRPTAVRPRLIVRETTGAPPRR